MAPRGRPPLPRGVLAFDAPGWEPPRAVVLDTSVVVGALLPNQPRQAWEKMRGSLDSSLVEIHEIAEDVPGLMQQYGLQSYDAVHAATLLDSGITDFLTRDGGFAVLPSTVATLHTTQARVTGTRARRRRAGY